MCIEGTEQVIGREHLQGKMKTELNILLQKHKRIRANIKAARNKKEKRKLQKEKLNIIKEVYEKHNMEAVIEETEAHKDDSRKIFQAIK